MLKHIGVRCTPFVYWGLLPPFAHFEPENTQMERLSEKTLDLRAELVVIRISHDRKRVWINTEAGCPVRIDGVAKVTIDDLSEVRR